MIRVLPILAAFRRSSADNDDFFRGNELEEFRGTHLRNLLAEMLVSAGSEHEAESFFEYGCWCSSSPRANRHDFTKGRSQPVDELDKVCRDAAYCHMCLKIDFEEECDFYQNYNYTISSEG